MQGVLTAESHGCHGWPEMRLGAARHWAEAGEQSRVMEGRGGGAGVGGGFWKISLEDFTKEFFVDGWR